MQQIFYRHDVRVIGWSLRGEFDLSGDIDHPDPKYEAYYESLLENPSFIGKYHLLKSIAPIDSFQRWEACFREFILYNHVGRVQPDQGGTKDRKGDFNIFEDEDAYGKHIRIDIYSQLSNDDWSDIKRTANKQLREYHDKWSWRGRDLELLAIVAQLDRYDPKLSNAQIASRLDMEYPALPQKQNGYTEGDVAQMLIDARRFHF